MFYKELPKEWKQEAKGLIKDSIDQWEEEMAREQGRKPIYYSLRSDIFKEQLAVREFEIVTDEVSKKESLVLV